MQDILKYHLNILKQSNKNPCMILTVGQAKLKMQSQNKVNMELYLIIVFLLLL